jgi:hypothetical protein
LGDGIGRGTLKKKAAAANFPSKDFKKLSEIQETPMPISKYFCFSLAFAYCLCV